MPLDPKETLKQIKELISEKNYTDSYKLCISVINAYPDNIKAIRLKTKIEQLVEKQNEAAVKEELKKTDHLWYEQKYPELIQALTELQQYAPHNTTLKKLRIKAQKKYKKHTIKATKEFIKSTKKEIKKHASHKEFEKALLEEKKLKDFLSFDPSITSFLTKIRRKYINHLIKAKQELLNSTNYTAILSFLTELQTIDPSYLKVFNLRKKFQKNYFSEQENSQREFIFQGLENIKTLFRKKKYDQVINGLQEILTFAKHNKEAKSLLKKAQSKRDHIMTTAIISQIEESFSQMKSLRKKDKKKFVSL